MESKREAAKEKKYARNPQKKAFMVSLLDALHATGVAAGRSQGESYRCWFQNPAWPKDSWVSLSIHTATPQLYFPKTLQLKLDPPLADTTIKSSGEYNFVSFYSVSTTAGPPSVTFVKAVTKVLAALVVP